MGNDVLSFVIASLYSYNKTNEMQQFLKFIFGIELCMFRTGSLPIIRSLALCTPYIPKEKAPRCPRKIELNAAYSCYGNFEGYNRLLPLLLIQAPILGCHDPFPSTLQTSPSRQLHVQANRDKAIGTRQLEKFRRM
jgi:hypothetical protein